MNATLAVILRRLPNKPLLSPREIADACGFVTTAPIKEAVRAGAIPAVRFGNHFVIARDVAIEFLQKRTY